MGSRALSDPQKEAGLKMPGHIKLVKGAVDPDPTDFLWPTMDMKKEDQAKPYDPKASVWIQDPKTHGYKEGLLESGDITQLGMEGADVNVKMTVAVAHEKFTLKAGEVGRVNPPKFEKCEDMVNLTYLNDASVFWNLKTRYQAKLIHTYSGLFVVVVNPYKRYPLYTHRVCKTYLGKRRNEAPPHLWSIAEVAYRKLLEAQVKDAANRVDEAEQNALKGGKKAIAKMETRTRELESELDAETRRCTDAQKNLRKSERHIKELTYQQDEDRKNHERMQGLIDQLQAKIKSYKKQIEEAEEIAALNLAKYRQVQSNLTGSTERADLNEQALAKTRARGRSASIGPL